MKPNPYENLDKKVLFNRILKAEKTYPEGHPQLKSIGEQKRDLINRYPELAKE